MKTLAPSKLLQCAALALAVLVSLPLAAAPAEANSNNAVTLSRPSGDILKMSRAGVGDSIIVTYIRNSGTSYGLSAEQVVYLREQGVSESVLNTMLNQTAKLTENANRTTVAQSSPAYSASAQPAVTSPVYSPPQTVYVAPSYAPASSVYVIPYSTGNYWSYYPSYYSYGCGPYYRSSFGFYGSPSLSFSFGFGHHSFRGHHSRGGW